MQVDGSEYMLRYSRHARRRMTLYGICDEDVALVVRKGKRDDLPEPGRVSFTMRLSSTFKYPIKVVGLERGNDLLVITTYPLKRERIQDESDIR
jgi:hypothetical protein